MLRSAGVRLRLTSTAFRMAVITRFRAPQCLRAPAGVAVPFRTPLLAAAAKGAASAPHPSLTAADNTKRKRFASPRIPRSSGSPHSQCPVWRTASAREYPSEACPGEQRRRVRRRRSPGHLPHGGSAAVHRHPARSAVPPRAWCRCSSAQPPHVNRLRNQCAQCGALIARSAGNTSGSASLPHVRPGSVAVMPRAEEGHGARQQLRRKVFATLTLTKSALGVPDPRRFPPQFPPFGIPPS